MYTYSDRLISFWSKFLFPYIYMHIYIYKFLFSYIYVHVYKGRADLGIMWLSGILDNVADGLISKWGSIIKSPWVRTATSQRPSWYDLKCFARMWHFKNQPTFGKRFYSSEHTCCSSWKHWTVCHVHYTVEKWITGYRGSEYS